MIALSAPVRVIPIDQLIGRNSIRGIYIQQDQVIIDSPTPAAFVESNITFIFELALNLSIKI